jgi:hypothetical protein
MVNPIDRRDFIKGSVGLYLSSMTGLYASTTQPEFLIAPEKYFKSRTFGVGIINLNKEMALRVPTRFEGHVVIPHTQDGDLAIMAAQRPGTVSYLFSISKQKIIQAFKSSKDHHFYGHGIIMNGGNEVWMTEVHNDSGLGKIVKRSFPKMEIVGEFDSGGYGPHEMVHINKSNQFVVAHGGDFTSKSSQLIYDPATTDKHLSKVSYFSQKDGQKLNETDCPDPEKIMSIRHLDVHRETETVVMTIIRPHENKTKKHPCIGYQEKGKAIKFFETPPEIYDELKMFGLSIKVSQKSGKVALTSHKGNAVAFWDLNSKKFMGIVKMPEPMGVTYCKDEELWAVSTTKDNIIFLDQKTLKPNSKLSSKFKGLNCSHMINTKNLT